MLHMETLIYVDMFIFDLLAFVQLFDVGHDNFVFYKVRGILQKSDLLSVHTAACACGFSTKASRIPFIKTTRSLKPNGRKSGK